MNYQWKKRTDDTYENGAQWQREVNGCLVTLIADDPCVGIVDPPPSALARPFRQISAIDAPGFVNACPDVPAGINPDTFADGYAKLLSRFAATVGAKAEAALRK